MSSLLGSRKQCFYCGHKSSKAVPRNTRRWHCEHCQAVNYLDENGEITDPPAEEVSSSQQATQRFARATSPGPSDSSLFCGNCLKNQQILTQLLSNYLPTSEDDPDYAQREAHYPQYKKELEDRYPPVCLDCEPRVRERIRQTGYAAKTDHLKKLMERSRRRRIGHHWGWRSLLVRTAGFGQLFSLLGYLCWTSSIIASGLNQPSEERELITESLVGCAIRLGQGNQISPGCLDQLSMVAGWSLLVGFFTSWWNPKWQDKIQGRAERLKGLEKYYTLQAIALAARFSMWLFTGDFDANGSKLLWTIHVVSVPILLVLLGMSLRSVSINTTPLVSWQMDVAPLISSESVARSEIGMHSSVASRKDPYHMGQAAFPISSLAPTNTVKQDFTPIPMPPPSDTDEMEWEPSQDFRPTSYADRYPEKIVQPSPFYGRLPPAPNTRSLGLKAQTAPPPRDSIGLAPGHFDKPSVSLLPAASQPQESGFAPPTFFPMKDRDTDTGLETLFGKVFSLGEEVTGSAQPSGSAYNPSNPNQVSQTTGVGPRTASSKWSEIHLVSAFVLAVLLAGWVIVGYLDVPALQLKMVMTGGLGAASALLLVTTSIQSQQQPVAVILYLIHTICAAVLTAHRYQGEYSNGGKIDHLVTALLALMIGQEVLLSASSSSTFHSSTPSSHANYQPVTKVSEASITNPPNSSSASSPLKKVRKTSKPAKPAVRSNNIPQYDGSFESPPPFPRTSSAAVSTANTMNNDPRYSALEFDSSTSDSEAESIVSSLTTNTSTSTLKGRTRQHRGSTPGLGGLGSLRLDDASGFGGYGGGFEYDDVQATPRRRRMETRSMNRMGR